MMKGLTLPEIAELLTTQGHLPYGDEPVSQLAHALQCATLAEQAQAPPTLIAACLLHDLGHLLHSFGADATAQGIDDRHEYRVIPYLRSPFSLAVTEPIRLHVQAKRYLCATQPDYWQNLSENSKQTLVLQGGIFSAHEAGEFIAQPYAQEAIQLRQWDDQAKQIDMETPDLAHFLATLERCINPA